MRVPRLSACLVSLTDLLVACYHDPAFDPPTFSEKQIEQARADGYVEGLFTLCAVLIDADRLRYMADTGTNLPNSAFQKYDPASLPKYVGKVVGTLCRGAARGTSEGPP